VTDRIHFPGHVPTPDLMLRVMGPDAHRAHYWVCQVTHEEGQTVAHLLPLPSAETRLVKDNWGQVRLDTLAVDADEAGRYTRKPLAA
jgi:hypothetical protein